MSDTWLHLGDRLDSSGSMSAIQAESTYSLIQLSRSQVGDPRCFLLLAHMCWKLDCAMWWPSHDDTAVHTLMSIHLARILCLPKILRFLPVSSPACPLHAAPAAAATPCCTAPPYLRRRGMQRLTQLMAPPWPGTPTACSARRSSDATSPCRTRAACMHACRMAPFAAAWPPCFSTPAPHGGGHRCWLVSQSLCRHHSRMAAHHIT